MKKITLSIITLCILMMAGLQSGYAQSKKKSNAEWKKILTADQYEILVNRGTEAPYHNAYWDNHEKGVYVSAATGEVLFSSEDKFDSHTGWPSDWAPLKDAVVERNDSSFGMARTEILCARCDAHLGHVFDDGPTPTGKRYCLNSVCLDLEKEK